MPPEKEIVIYGYDDKPKSYKIRAFYPMYVRDIIARKQIEAEKDDKTFSDYETLLFEMSTEPKISKEFLQSPDCDANEMDQLYVEICKVVYQVDIDPVDYIGLSDDEKRKKMEDLLKNNMLKKKEVRSRR